MTPKYQIGQEVAIVDSTTRSRGKITDAIPVKVRGETVAHDFFVEVSGVALPPFYDDEGENVNSYGAKLEPAQPETATLRDRILSKLLEHLAREVERHTGGYSWPNTEEQAIDLVLREMVECYTRAEDDRMRERCRD